MSDPKNLGSQINSGAKDEYATFTPDGQTMVFTSTREGGFGSYDLYVSHLEKGEWTKAELLPLPINTQKDDFDPFITPDGKALYLNSIRGEPDKKDVDIWRFEFKQGKWSNPRLMEGHFADKKRKISSIKRRPTMKEKQGLFLLILFILISTVPSTAQQASSQEQSSLTFLIVGGRDGFIKRFGEVTPFRQIFYSSDKKKLAEKMLLSIACKPLSKEQIIQHNGLSEDEFEEISSLLLSLNMISSKNGTWATTLPVLTGGEMTALRQKLSLLAAKMAEATSSSVPQIKNLYDQNRLPSDPEWEETAHLFISYFLLDTFLLRSLSTLEENKGFRRYYSEKQKIIPAFFLEAGENFTNFGCNSYSFQGNENNQSIYVFVLHGTLFERIQISLNKYEKNPDLSSVLFKLIPQEEKPSLSDQELKILDDLGWLENNKLKVPMINSRIRAPLIPLLTKAAESTAEVVFENFNIILDTFNDSPYSKFSDGAGDYIQYSYHVLMYLTIEKLIQTGVLPAIPKPVPEYFGTYVLYSSDISREDGKN